MSALYADERRELERLRGWYREYITEIFNARGPDWKPLSEAERAEMRERVFKRTSAGVVYISGPMTGQPDYNYPAFHAAAKRWREAGWEVLNPAENFEGRTDRTYAEYIREDMKMLLRADAIAMLAGWSSSRGAKWELHTAQLLGLPAYVAESAGTVKLWDVRIDTRVVFE